MPDLSTTYLGLPLENPLVPSSSPLSRDLDAVLHLEDAGAAAIVMHSLFEEDVRHDEQMYLLIHSLSCFTLLKPGKQLGSTFFSYQPCPVFLPDFFTRYFHSVRLILMLHLFLSF